VAIHQSEMNFPMSFSGGKLRFDGLQTHFDTSISNDFTQPADFNRPAGRQTSTKIFAAAISSSESFLRITNKRKILGIFVSDCLDQKQPRSEEMKNVSKAPQKFSLNAPELQLLIWIRIA
jgi:hypothetical protein